VDFAAVEAVLATIKIRDWHWLGIGRSGIRNLSYGKQ